MYVHVGQYVLTSCEPKCIIYSTGDQILNQNDQSHNNELVLEELFYIYIFI